MSFLKRRSTLMLSLLVAFATSGLPALALDGARNGGQKAYSVDEVTRMIREKGGWKVLSTQTKQDEKGRSEYRFKLLNSDGRVKVLSVDPRSPELGRLK